MSLDQKDSSPTKAGSAQPPPLVSENDDARDPSLWLEKYGDAMFRYATLQLKNEALAEELVQDSFVSAIKALDSFEGRSSVKTWLFTILRNKIIDHCRKTNRVRVVSLEEISGTDNDSFFNSLGIWKQFISNWGQHPDEQLEGKEFFKVFESCLSKLPDKLREVFILRVVDGLETKVICNELEISSSNMWVIMHRARLLIRECIDKNWFQVER